MLIWKICLFITFDENKASLLDCFCDIVPECVGGDLWINATGNRESETPLSNFALDLWAREEKCWMNMNVKWIYKQPF